MKKIVYLLYQPYKFLIFFPWLVLSTFFFALWAVILVYIANPKIASMVCGSTWARLNAYMTPMWVKVSGRGNIAEKQSYVIVSNHQSQYDIFVLYGWLGVDFKWVMKQELRKVPGIGIGCEKIGHIFIDRSNHESAIASLNAAKEKIVNGTSVLFFPEGTRSRDVALGPFKKGAFKMAIDLGLPILPITIAGTRNILPSNTMKLFPGKAHMIIHEPIDISGFNDANLPELIERTRSMIQSGLGVQSMEK
ncbi:MAG: acyl-phosphate glycerol 3-phosphate acyltransferase [Spirochaetes bacterium RBG_16_49_21]|nr:MAG: acyl-phosphate glycerol 3-phosphate acyltransferase [Spirochaetes bacterium RBG_16_49_21]